LKLSNEDRLNKFYKKEVNKIEQKLTQLLKRKKPDSLYDACRYSLESGGKKLRPMLVLLSAKAVGGKFTQVYNAALAVELLHTFTLVHDDIMDNSLKRRGKETVYKRYDYNTAILAGDILAAIAFETLLMDCKNNSREVISAFTKGLITVCEGQGLDKEFELKVDVSLEQYREMIYKKTAALIEMCCNISSLLCNAKKNHVDQLTAFGKNLGIAFQIQDDLLDIIGDENEFGKVIGSDLIEGKKTYLLLKAINKADEDLKNELMKIIRSKGIEKSEIPHYIKIYSKLGVIEDAKKEIIRYTNLALRHLSKLPDTEGRNLLSSLAYSLVKRSK
jgi:geranylgeranyl pyrophosphate synthase